MPDTTANMDPIYSIDRFGLFLRISLSDLWNIVESRNLKQHARTVRPLLPTEKAAWKGYQSQLSVVKPDSQCLPLLSRALRNIYHRVNSMELACDVPQETIDDARELSSVIDQILRCLEGSSGDGRSDWTGRECGWSVEGGEEMKE